MIQTRRFYKEEERWYIDLPEFLELNLGTKDNLLMVLGADDLLDYLSKNSNEITLQFSDEMKFRPDETLVKIQEGKDDDELIAANHPLVDEGAYYVPLLNEVIETVWLCPVTRWVFEGIYPKNIYIRVV